MKRLIFLLIAVSILLLPGCGMTSMDVDEAVEYYGWRANELEDYLADWYDDEELWAMFIDNIHDENKIVELIMSSRYRDDILYYVEDYYEVDLIR